MLAGLTQEELAERAGLSVRGISDLERGSRHVPRRGTLLMLLEALQLEEEERRRLEDAGRRIGRPGLGTAQATTAGSPEVQRGQRGEQLIGRERELKDLESLIFGDGDRIVTLTGPGGVGKSALALQLVETAGSRFREGGRLVSLADVDDPKLAAPRLTEDLGLREPGAAGAEEALVEVLRDSETLLVVDNFEQVVEAAPLISRIVASCPRVVVLVTSRVVLRIQGEHVYEIHPLALPDGGAAESLGSRCSPAVELFVRRAAQAGQTELDPEDLTAIGEICRRLDGLPLAIELAAARTRILPPGAMAEQLTRPLQILRGGRRDAPKRHQTLRSTIDWSYNLLTAEQQHLFCALSCFAGGCTIEAVEDVSELLPWNPEEPVLDQLATLVDASLVRRDARPGQAARLTLLETIRDYGRERLDGRADAAEVRNAHAAWIEALVRKAEPELLGADQAVWLARVDEELENIRAALAWCVETADRGRGLRIATGLARFCYARSHLTEARTWLAGLLPADPGLPGEEAAGVPAALVWAAAFASDQGDYDEAETLARQGLQLAVAWGQPGIEALSQNVLGNVARNKGDVLEAVGCYQKGLEVFTSQEDGWGMSLSLNNLGAAAREGGDIAEAMERYRHSLELARQIGDLWTAAIVLDNLGEVTAEAGDSSAAVELFQESLGLRRSLGDVWGMADAQSAMAGLLLQQGEVSLAREAYEESLARYVQVGDRWRSAVCLEGLAAVAQREGKPEVAAQIFGAASALRDAIRHPLRSIERADYDRSLEKLNEVLGEDVFAAAWHAGRAMNLHQASQYIMEVES